MRIDLKTLKNFDVETVSGDMLGRVYDVEIEIEGQIISQYKVKPAVISRKKYFISRNQIVKFAPNKIIVDDSVAVDKKSETRAKSSVPEAEPALMAKRN